MSRKPIRIFDASVSIVCRSSSCDHEFMVPPKRLQKKQPIICPKCHYPNEFTDGEVLKLLGDNVQGIREDHRRIWGELKD